jgi:nitrate reductase gamma subunit
MLFFIGQVFPYIAVGVFIIGMAIRIRNWLKAPVPFQLTLFPAPKDSVGRITVIGRELLLFDSLLRGDRGLWFWAWTMHVSLAMIIFGHIVGIATLTQQFTMFGLSPAASSQLSAFFGTIAGIAFLISLIVLFYRRTAIPELKRLSDPADYFDILLLLSIVVSGMHMRVTTHEVDLPVIRSYLGNLLTFSPTPVPHDWVFISHYFLVNVLLMYFPFSKMAHLAGFFVNRSILTEPAPVYPTPDGTKRDVRVFRKGGQPA